MVMGGRAGFPRVEVERVTREFLVLEQRSESVTEITRRFREMAFFCPEYVAIEPMKITRYFSMLRTDIREIVINMEYDTLESLVTVARRCELELEEQARARAHLMASEGTLQTPSAVTGIISRPYFLSDLIYIVDCCRSYLYITVW
jgi:hypothetical protein